MDWMLIARAAFLAGTVAFGFSCSVRAIKGQAVAFRNIALLGISVAGFVATMGWLS